MCVFNSEVYAYFPYIECFPTWKCTYRDIPLITHSVLKGEIVENTQHSNFDGILLGVKCAPLNQ
jgi:hypothetical protein